MLLYSKFILLQAKMKKSISKISFKKLKILIDIIYYKYKENSPDNIQQKNKKVLKKMKGNKKLILQIMKMKKLVYMKF